MDVGEERFLVLVGNWRDHRIPNCIVFWDYGGWPPKGPELSLKKSGVIGQSTKIEGIGMRAFFVIEQESALHHIDSRDILGD